VILNHLIGIELRSQGLVFFVAWVSVQRRDRHLAQPSFTPFWVPAFTQGVCPKTWQAHCFLFPFLIWVHTVCLSKDVTGHCSFYCIAIPRSLSLPDFLFSLVIIASFLDCFSAHTVCLSKDVTGYCSFYCIAIPRPLILPDSFGFSWQLCLPLGLFIALSFHSVSVQRRGRYSVSHFDLIWSLYYLFFLLFAQCVCPKTWQVLCFLLLLFRFTLFVFRCSLLVTQCICPKTWQVLCYLYHSPFFCLVIEGTFPPPFLC